MSDTTFNIHETEQVLAQIRKHWFPLLEQLLGIAFVAILPFLFAGFASGAFGSSSALSGLFLFFSSLWLLVALIMVGTVWTNHFLDLWVVTDRRIIHIEQVRFFVREVTTVPLERIQDATIRYNNMIETLLDFGTLRVQSAGAAKDDVLMHGIPHPTDIKRFMLSEAERHHRAAGTAKPEPI